MRSKSTYHILLMVENPLLGHGHPGQPAMQRPLTQSMKAGGWIEEQAVYAVGDYFLLGEFRADRTRTQAWVKKIMYL